MGLRDLAGEIYARSLPQNPDGDKDEAFEDRSVKLETTFGGAGVLHGDLTRSAPRWWARCWMRCRPRRARRTPGRRRSGSTTVCTKRRVSLEIVS